MRNCKIDLSHGFTQSCFDIDISHILWSGWLSVYINGIHIRLPPQSGVFHVDNIHPYLISANNPGNRVGTLILGGMGASCSNVGHIIWYIVVLNVNTVYFCKKW